jgi:hypothetical protein
VASTVNATKLLAASSTFQLVAAKSATPAGTAATTKKSILLKAPPNKVVTQQQQAPLLNTEAKRSTKLQPGIIRMTSPKAPAIVTSSLTSSLATVTAVVTKVDIGTSITPVKDSPIVTPSSDASAVAVSSVQQVSRRLQLPDEEPATTQAEPTAALEDGEPGDVSLECQEVFDDSFEKNCDETSAKTPETEDKQKQKICSSEETNYAEISVTAEKTATVRSASPAAGTTMGEATVDLLKPLPEPGPEVRGPPLPFRTNEFGLIELVATTALAKPAATAQLRVSCLRGQLN